MAIAVAVLQLRMMANEPEEHGDVDARAQLVETLVTSG